MTIKLGNSIKDLQNLVPKFEAKEHELKDIPKNLVNEFGYACLANTLMIKEPKYPKYDEENISEYIKTHQFNNLNSLISYINSLKTDIDKLFAIFSWAALNIEYDAQTFFSGKHKETSLEIVFQTRKAVCEGYALFVKEMAKKVNINTKKIRIESYSNYAKGFGFDDLNPPKEVKSNHASVYIEIDGIQYISEPTWAAGHLENDCAFHWKYSPKLFLIPLFKSLCDHFPCGESQKLLPFKFPFSDFLKSCKVDPFDRYLKTETIPYVNFESKDGYVEQVYSCTGPIKFVIFSIYQLKNNTFYEIDSEPIANYQIVQSKLPKHPNICRFKTSVAFAEKGFYKIKVFLDGPHILTYYVNALSKSSLSSLLKYNAFHESKFVPISPTRILTAVKNGFAMIRFAVIPKRSALLWDITKLSDPNGFDKNGETIDRKFGRYISLNIPFDQERYEDQLCVTFPSNGRYSVLIYLANDKGSYTTYMTYFFDVSGVKSSNPEIVNPAKYVFKNRTFSPKRIVDSNNNEVIVKPNQNCFYVNNRDQSISIKTAKNNDDIHLELKSEDKTVVFVKQSGNDGEFRRFDWSIPEEFGEYHLKGWINDDFAFDFTYIYSNEKLKDPTKEENQLLNEYRSRIEGNVVSEANETDDKNDKKTSDEVEKKRSSKCCLLI